MITLEDIAKKAGVSHSTVSRALAGSPLVNSETKERIQTLAQDFGYQVNQVARNLKSRSTRTIGLIVPEVLNPYYPKLIQRVADLVKEAGFSLQLLLSGANQESEAACISSLRENRADGILLVTAEQGLVARDQVNSLVNAGIPIVLMGWVEDADHIDLVTGDDAKGGEELAEHLLNLGHTRVAIIGKPAHRGEFDRVLGFTRAFEKAGLSLSDEMVAETQSEESVKLAIEALLTNSDPPTAIFAYQDSLAALVYKHLAHAGVSIPLEMTVVGFDDIDLASFLSPQLTTVGGHIEPLASDFVKLLIERIRNQREGNGADHKVAIPKVIVRSSCSWPRTTRLPLRQLVNLIEMETKP
ncbi:MAG: LacI family DNA-binding transcriptional regulator [Armatimonadota bacterium]